jgi:hypothetical protein
VAAQHLFNTLEPTFESSRAHLDPLRQVSGRLAHLCGMTSEATIRELFEPVLTLAELADYLHVPAQTIYDWVCLADIDLCIRLPAGHSPTYGGRHDRLPERNVRQDGSC